MNGRELERLLRARVETSPVACAMTRRHRERVITDAMRYRDHGPVVTRWAIDCILREIEKKGAVKDSAPGRIGY